MTPVLAVLTLAGILAIAWGFTRILPSLTTIVLGTEQGRDQTLDGFRGLLGGVDKFSSCVGAWRKGRTIAHHDTNLCAQVDWQRLDQLGHFVVR
jgi:hypothetical protein